jgi:hypothetical protein
MHTHIHGRTNIRMMVAIIEQKQNKQVDVTRISLASFSGSKLRLLKRSSLKVHSIRSNAVWCVSYQLLDRPWYSDLTADCSVYLVWKWSSRRMRPVDRGCLLLLGTLSGHLWYIQGSLYVHFSDLYFLQVLSDWWLLVMPLPCTCSNVRLVIVLIVYC